MNKGEVKMGKKLSYIKDLLSGTLHAEITALESVVTTITLQLQKTEAHARELEENINKKSELALTNAETARLVAEERDELLESKLIGMSEEIGSMSTILTIEEGDVVVLPESTTRKSFDEVAHSFLRNDSVVAVIRADNIKIVRFT